MNCPHCDKEIVGVVPISADLKTVFIDGAGEVPLIYEFANAPLPTVLQTNEETIWTFPESGTYKITRVGD